ncbi:type IV pilus modification protein PilV [Halomonas sp. ML-15]|uniref:type IV pilus modification protein PilV n=1 Tax=Halomonas sp. ML-15 TaxID=2773305 RepID=UPI0017477412|nr:type IV pilus modification protein PilV [Halomonas sp. ML-15]MBD3897939.1 type IV pilus modification protein PilV [Halomonas sp. ML-15]
MNSAASKGFTLIEALVALLVLSIGMLGVAAMQLNALQGAHAAYQRSIASLAAQDAQERLWAEMARQGGLACPDEGVVNGTGEGWDAQWSPFLPGLGSSPVGPPDECEFIISITWDEKRFEEGGGESFSYIVRLPGEVSP